VFTGIVEELGTVESVAPGRLVVAGKTVCADARPGDSIAVNGVCLTVVDTDGELFAADVMRETLDRSSLGELRPGDRVNLERAATLGTRLGGHLVQGHVDGVGTITRREPGRGPGGGWETVRFALPARLARYVAEKGSIAVDGVSLTVAAVGAESAAGGRSDDGSEPHGEARGSDWSQESAVKRPEPGPWFEVGLIPTTLALTTLGTKGVGEPVNLEVDVIAKYVERLLGARHD